MASLNGLMNHKLSLNKLALLFNYFSFTFPRAESIFNYYFVALTFFNQALGLTSGHRQL